MINLKNVTLFAYTGLDEPDHISKTLKSLQHSASQIAFGAVKMIAPVGYIDDDNIELIVTEKADHIEYSRFSVEELVNYIDTEYCIGVQWDSSIINPDLWENDFLNFDYIGAPWMSVPYRRPDVSGHHYVNRVGNGGFSLRSKRFLQISAELTYDPYHYEYKCAPEDWFLCVKNYGYMMERSIRFADPVTASRFSVETPSPEKPYDIRRLETYRSFGFHYEKNIAGMEAIGA
jgi:hypothetical protein